MVEYVVSFLIVRQQSGHSRFFLSMFRWRYLKTQFVFYYLLACVSKHIRLGLAGCQNGTLEWLTTLFRFEGSFSQSWLPRSHAFGPAADQMNLDTFNHFFRGGFYSLMTSSKKNMTKSLWGRGTLKMPYVDLQQVPLLDHDDKNVLSAPLTTSATIANHFVSASLTLFPPEYVDTFATFLSKYTLKNNYTCCDGLQ